MKTADPVGSHLKNDGTDIVVSRTSTFKTEISNRSKYDQGYNDINYYIAIIDNNFVK